MPFEIVGEITQIETIAVGKGVQDRPGQPTAFGRRGYRADRLVEAKPSGARR
jgi:hypothetical protein